ncbi:MAG: family 10 glycosylhydrolase [Candidatus Manganitrophus sp. SA1]|nr:family 10 glycosylhydrolase [Candidatus Manganitrophus morganii]
MKCSKYFFMFFVCSFMFVFILIFPEESFSLFPDEERIILYEDYEAISGSVELYGAVIVSDQERGRSLQLTAETFAEIKPSQALSAKAGTLSFWMKPLWEQESEKSHTFLTLPWADSQKSYMAVSHGWWEPLGSKRLYFILSNEESIHCSALYGFDLEAWVMITAVWESGDPGYCKLYVNGEKIAENQKTFSGDYVNGGPLYLGTDKGTTSQKGRGAESLLGSLIIFDRPFSSQEVFQFYQTQEKDLAAAYDRKWEWLNTGLTVPLVQRRDRQGRLIENRAIFDEAMSWAFSKEAADKILSRVKAAGFNIYIPCVWHGRGTYYPSRIASTDPKVASKIPLGYDPLAYLIQKAHSMGIEVHPWFTVVKRESAEYAQFFDEGVPEGAFDIHNIEFRKFIRELILDVVRRYDIDGLNLDYIRAMGLCTSVDCQNNYYRATGFPLLEDLTQSSVDESARWRLQKWQDVAVTDIVKNLSTQARILKPKLIISIDGQPKAPGGELRALEGRDELAWANYDWVDVVFGMDYRQRIDFENVDAVRSTLKQPEKMIVLFGNYDKMDDQSEAIPRTGDLVAKYAAFAQRRWPGTGMGLYIYSKLTDEQVNALRTGPFLENAFPVWKAEN